MKTNYSLQRYAVFFIVITVAIESIGFGIILPVLPQLIMTLTGEGLGKRQVMADGYCSPIL